MSDTICALVVDDDAGVRFVLGETLRRAGHAVTQAESGEAALSLLRDNAFDLAIVDLDLGTRIDGLRVLEAIRWRWPQMAVLILTAHGSLESAVAAIREGVDGYLLKPAEPKELLAATREALARRRNRPAQLANGGATPPVAAWRPRPRSGQTPGNESRPTCRSRAGRVQLARALGRECASHRGAERAGARGPGV